MGITPKQKEVLEFVQSYSSKKGYAPTQQEIAKYFGFKSLGTVQNYLVRLERSGFLTREGWNARRGTKITPLQPTQETHAFHRAVPLPLLGRVAAGLPIEAIENPDSIDVPASMIPSHGDHFVLEVVGDSMIEDGILEGDRIIVQRQHTATNGQTVVAVVDGSATVKKFFRTSQKIELHAANAAYQPIVVPFSEVDDFEIKGIVVGLMRQI